MTKEAIRLKILPQKIGVLVWRVKQMRIPVRVELDKRGVDLDSVLCLVCEIDLDTVERIFLHCSFAKDLWARFFRWWSINRPLYSCLDHMFNGDIGSSKSKLWQVIEWVCGYLIRRNRNLTLFQRKKGSGLMTLNEVQIKAFEWISRRSRKSIVEWNQCLINLSTFDDHG
ncbi:uncharacterized protein [Rutidosis leptorrhynchoides]|uniref:uncharacterized protein n=1 Tax=Rutidosis leptorrhynchoides TaxID=125765 RepID=UPI003A98DEFA